MKKIFIAFLILFSTWAKGQQVMDLYGTTGNDQFRHIQLLPGGDYVVTGFVATPANAEDVYVARLNPQGGVVWERIYGDAGNDEGYFVIVDPVASTVIVSGFSTNAANNRDALLMEIDFNGNLVWARTYGILNLNEHAASVSFSQNGNALLVAGSNIAPNSNTPDMLIFEVSRNGAVINWQNQIGINTGSGDASSKAFQTALGGYVVMAQSFTGTSWDPVLITLNANGQLTGQLSFGTNGLEAGRDLLQLPNGDLIVLSEVITGGSQDIVLSSYTSQLVLQWRQVYGTAGADFPWKLNTTITGGYSVVGQTNGTGAGGDDAYIFTTDNLGNLLQSATFGGIGNEAAFGVVQNNDMSFSIVGFGSTGSNGGNDGLFIRTAAGAVINNCSGGNIVNRVANIVVHAQNVYNQSNPNLINTLRNFVPQNILVTRIVNQIAPPVVPDAAICGPGQVTLSVTNPPANISYTWYDQPVNGTLLNTGATYQANYTNNTTIYVEANNQCVSSVRVAVIVTVNPIPSSPTVPNVGLCGPGTVTMSVTSPDANLTYRWYDAITGGTLLHTGTTYAPTGLTVTTSFWVEAENNSNCISARTQVTVNVIPTRITGVTRTLNCTSTTLTAVTDPAIPFAGSYNWQISRINVPAGNQTNLANFVTATPTFTFNYAAFPLDADDLYLIIVTGSGGNVCGGASSGSFRPPVIPSTPIVPNVGLCGPGSVTMAVTNPDPNLTYRWYDAATGGTLLWTGNSYSPVGLTVTTSFWIEAENNSNCISARTQVTVNVIPTRITGVTRTSNCTSTVLTAITNPALPLAGTYNWSINQIDVSALGTFIHRGDVVTTNPTFTLDHATFPIDVNDLYVVIVTGSGANVCGGASTGSFIPPSCCPASPIVPGVSGCAGQVSMSVSGPIATETYRWYDALTGGTLLYTGATINPTETSTTTFYVEADNGTCISARTPVTVTILNPIVTLTGPAFVYANGIVDYNLTITNNNAGPMTITLPLAPYSNRPDFTILVPPSITSLTLAAGASQVVTYRGFFTTAGVPAGDLCFDVVDDNGCTTTACLKITAVVAGCPFSYSIVSSDCDQAYPQTRNIHLSGHNNFFDVSKIDFNFTYDNTKLLPSGIQIAAGAPSGATISSNININGNITTVSGTVNYDPMNNGTKVDVLSSDGDGDIVITNIIEFDVEILSNPSLSSPPVCELQMSTTGTRFYVTNIDNVTDPADVVITPFTRPTDPVRILFQCAACPLVSAFFTATPNPALQNELVTFTANPSDGSHSWESGANNNQQIAKTTSTVTYKYAVPGDYVVTHYRTVNGVTGIYQETVTVCGITTGVVLPNASLCAGNAVSVPFTASACAGYTAGNVFTAQLSDANGNFTNAVNMGTLTGTVSGTINAVIPAGTVTGTGYRVRVISSSPAMNGTSNAGYTLSVNGNCNTLSFNGLHLDGSDDQVTIPHHSSYDIGGGDFTIETWIKLGAGNHGKPLVSNRFIKPVPGQWPFPNLPFPNLGKKNKIDGFLLSVYNGHLEFETNDYSKSIFANILDDNCHHIVLRRFAGILTVYIDGQVKGTIINGKSITSSGPLYIGHDAIDNSYAKGNFNELRLWNVARTAAEISASNGAVSTTATGLIGYWQFNESSGQAVIDVSNTSNNGYLGTNSQVDGTDPLRSTESCSPGANLPSLRMGNVSNNTVSVSNVQIYPNPFTQGTNIYFASEEDKLVHVKITNLSGAIVFEGEFGTNQENQIGEQFPVGMYLLHIKTGEIHSTQKLIKIE